MSFSSLGKRRHLVASFSYFIEDIAVIDEIDEIAKEDGVSFSQVVMQQLKELVHQRKSANGGYQQQQRQASSQCDIRLWLPRDDAYEMARRLRLDTKECEHLSQTFQIIAQKIRTGYLHRS